MENFISRAKAVPIVQICVQGGPGTIATVLATAEEGNPCILLTDSGGAATGIYEFVTSGKLDPKFVKQEEKLARIKQLHEVGGPHPPPAARLRSRNLP